MADDVRRIHDLLEAGGWTKERNGRGTHEIWRCPAECGQHQVSVPAATSHVGFHKGSPLVKRIARCAKDLEAKRQRALALAAIARPAPVEPDGQPEPTPPPTPEPEREPERDADGRLVVIAREPAMAPHPRWPDQDLPDEGRVEGPALGRVRGVRVRRQPAVCVPGGHGGRATGTPQPGPPAQDPTRASDPPAGDRPGDRRGGQGAHHRGPGVHAGRCRGYEQDDDDASQGRPVDGREPRQFLLQPQGGSPRDHPAAGAAGSPPHPAVPATAAAGPGSAAASAAGTTGSARPVRRDHPGHGHRRRGLDASPVGPGGWTTSPAGASRR